MGVCALARWCRYPWRSEEVVVSRELELQVVAGHCWDLNSGPRADQQILITMESPLRGQVLPLYMVCNLCLLISLLNLNSIILNVIFRLLSCNFSHFYPLQSCLFFLLFLLCTPMGYVSLCYLPVYFTIAPFLVLSVIGLRIITLIIEPVLLNLSSYCILIIAVW